MEGQSPLRINFFVPGVSPVDVLCWIIEALIHRYCEYIGTNGLTELESTRINSVLGRNIQRMV